MADGLYLADGTFRTFSIESLTTELATRQNAGCISATWAGGSRSSPDPPVLGSGRRMPKCSWSWRRTIR